MTTPPPSVPPEPYTPEPYSPPPYSPEPNPIASTPPGIDEKGNVKRTKVSAIWVGLIATALVLIALLIFIGQNSAEVTIHFLGAHGRVSLAVALLLSAVAGLLIAAIRGTVRILQLRRSLKRNAAQH